MTAVTTSTRTTGLLAWEHVTGFVKRLGWGVADQAASSLTNFVVGIYVARTLGPAGFGAFSLAFAAYLVTLAASRGLSTDALLIRYSTVSADAWRRGTAKATGLAVGIGITMGAVFAVAGAVIGGPHGMAFVALGVTLPGLMLQDAWRFAFFAGKRGGRAFLNDLVWAAVLTALLTLIVETGHTGVAWFVLAWGFSASLAACLGALQARVRPRVTASVAWVREHRDVAIRYLGEEVSLSGATQMRFYGLAAVATLGAVGALRTSELLLGPSSMLIMGMAMMAVPEASRVLRRSVRRLRSYCLLLGGLGAGGAAVWGVTLMLVLPGGLGERLLGESWEPASGLLLPTTITVTALGMSVGASAGLHALAAASRSLRAQVVRSALYLTGGLGGAVLAGAPGAAWGTAAGASLGVMTWWWEFHRGLRDHERRARRVRRAHEGAEPATASLT